MRRSRRSSPLPVRDGIQANSVYLPALQKSASSVLEFLAQQFPAVDQQRWRQRMLRGDVLDATGQPLAPDTPYLPDTRIYYYRELETEIPVPFQEQILYEDDHILVADKPHFLPVAPSGSYLHETLLTRLRQRTGCAHLIVLHRIDRDTAGLVLLSKNPASRDLYHALFRDRQLQKTYEALAPFREELVLPLTRESRIDVAAEFYRRQEVPGPVNAVSHIDLIERRGDLARYRLQPVTGKTHQLRLHMSALGIPILNDPYYPEERARGSEETTPRQSDFTQPLQLLAQALTFTDPVTGESRHFTSRQQLHWP